MSLLRLKSFFQGFPRPYKIWPLSSLVAHLYIALLAFSCPQGTLTMLLSGPHSYLLITPLLLTPLLSLFTQSILLILHFSEPNHISGKIFHDSPRPGQDHSNIRFFLTICLHIKIMKISNTYYTRHCAKSFIQFI